MATSKIVKKIYKDGQEYLIFGSGGAQNGLPDGGTVGQVVKRTETGAEWADESGGIQSSNDTYEDMVHLSQAEYEALETKDPNTLYSTPEEGEEGELFNPENVGEEGQVLTKTSTGYAFCDSQGGGGGAYIDFLLVGGGGGGGHLTSYSGYNGGGGGAGGVIERYKYNIELGKQYCVIIGEGGGPGCSGGDSSFDNIIMLGGGHGGGADQPGAQGGSGGGAGSSRCFCEGGLPSLYGNKGGDAGTGAGGGGGGAGGPGLNGYSCTACYVKGGSGVFSNISGTCVGAGGGGGVSGWASVCNHGGQGGGGNGGGNGATCKNGSTYGSGGGGGGCYSTGGGCGCQGVMYIRYKPDGSYGITCVDGGTQDTYDGYCRIKIDTSGTVTFY